MVVVMIITIQLVRDCVPIREKQVVIWFLGVVLFKCFYFVCQIHISSSIVVLIYCLYFPLIMAYKQEMKQSEARILNYLANADLCIRYPRAISAKLDIDYNYLLSITAMMVMKDWIKKEKTMSNKTIYLLTRAGQSMLPLAKETLIATSKDRETQSKLK